MFCAMAWGSHPFGTWQFSMSHQTDVLANEYCASASAIPAPPSMWDIVFLIFVIFHSPLPSFLTLSLKELILMTRKVRVFTFQWPFSYTSLLNCSLSFFLVTIGRRDAHNLEMKIKNKKWELGVWLDMKRENTK